ncbi:hypothetical protein L484_009616 [Morus notabilis]|uniref:RNase H type-1 domain-containing protein n=1 Tax=Morus notabilis TaxID=981085 RepID=W9RTF1_9ROSA|nr:hypothetical protein L484_009616 [Morus notabilis]
MEPNHQVHDYLAYYLDQAWRFNGNDHSVWKGIWNSKLHERFAAALWFGCPFASRRECWEGKSILDRVKFVIKPPSEAGFSKEGSFLFSLWGTIILDMIWRMRNEVAHGAVLQDPSKVLALCSKRVEDFKRNFKLGNTENGGSEGGRYFEQKDLFDISNLIINVDAACGSEGAAVGVVARHVEGGMVGVFARWKWLRPWLF